MKCDQEAPSKRLTTTIFEKNDKNQEVIKEGQEIQKIMVEQVGRANEEGDQKPGPHDRGSE
jgi:hypothetical protein